MRSTSGSRSAQCSPTAHLLWQLALDTFYKGSADQRGIEGLVWKSIVTQLPLQLIAMDPQRLGTPTAAYDLHFQEQFLQQKHELLGRGFLTVEYIGKREQLLASTKASQISPCYTDVVVKQLDPRCCFSTASSIPARDEETTGRAVPKLLAAELGVGLSRANATGVPMTVGNWKLPGRGKSACSKGSSSGTARSSKLRPHNLWLCGLRRCCFFFFFFKYRRGCLVLQLSRLLLACLPLHFLGLSACLLA